MNGIREAAVNGAIVGAGVAIWLVAGYLIQRFGLKPRTELRYRHCNIYGRIDVAVFSRSFIGIPYPITSRLTLTEPRHAPRHQAEAVQPSCSRRLASVPGAARSLGRIRFRFRIG